MKNIGVDYYSQTDKYKEDMHNVFKDIVNNPQKIQKIVQKRKKTCLQKYGQDTFSKTDEYKQKVKQTSLKKFGVDSYSKTDEYKQRVKQTSLKKFGVDSFLKTDKCKAKYKKFKLNLAFKYLDNYKDYVLPLFTEDEYIGREKEYKWKCVKCGNEFTQKIYRTSFNSELPYLPRCLKCYPFVQGFSGREKELVDFVKSIYNGKILENDRELIKPYELDIVIPEFKLAIEFDRRLLAFRCL